jgi:hypothetical protein
MTRVIKVLAFEEAKFKVGVYYRRFKRIETGFNRMDSKIGRMGQALGLD